MFMLKYMTDLHCIMKGLGALFTKRVVSEIYISRISWIKKDFADESQK